jgi:hypothetical protein
MSQRDRDEKERKERKREDSEERHREKPHGTGHGTERSVYLEHLARKWEGSAPPTPQAYARAIQLWRQLPGSVMAAPTDLGSLPQTGPDDESKEPHESDEHQRQGP